MFPTGPELLDSSSPIAGLWYTSVSPTGHLFSTGALIVKSPGFYFPEYAFVFLFNLKDTFAKCMSSWK